MTLEDNEFKDNEFSKYVEYGSVITLKGSFNFPCAYLHSHHQVQYRRTPSCTVQVNTRM